MNESTIVDEIAAGQGIALQEAARLIPPRRQGKRVTISCLFRWVADGVKGPNGQRVYLEAARVAGRWLTSREAVRRFVAAQQPARPGVIPIPRTPAQRSRASERAARELAKRGI